MNHISLIDVATYLPANIVDNSFFEVDIDPESIMFRGAKYRHHASDEETPAYMAVAAINRLATKLNLDLSKDVDLLLTNVTVPDVFFSGCGAEIAKMLDINPNVILDVHNSGCISFVYMMEIARRMMNSSNLKTALICNIQNVGHRFCTAPDTISLPQSVIPGDGCGVGYLVSNDSSPIKSITYKCHKEYATDMRLKSTTGRKWWNAGFDTVHINFTPDSGAKILRRSKKIVPDRVLEACQEAGIKSKDIDLLITNQPNPVFIKLWRKQIGIKDNAYLDTFDKHGNLFGAAIPIVLDEAIAQNKINPNDHLVLGGFSHAGDYSAAAVIHWHPGDT